jgi:uncharacterized membrane protein (Fun14 family)
MMVLDLHEEMFENFGVISHRVFVNWQGLSGSIGLVVGYHLNKVIHVQDNIFHGG